MALTTLELLTELIKKPSLTPEDAGCQPLIIEQLTEAGFTATQLRYEKVDNLWITHGRGKPLLVFAGHTDVVPTGPLSEWHSSPFIPTVRDGLLYGRGAADMKSGLAAMVTACRQFVTEYPDHPGTIALLITSDEEGPAQHGTKHVVEYLRNLKTTIDYCVVGEASSVNALGDSLKRGRRGSFHGNLTIYGEQGHIAYPQLAKNPIHDCLALLQELTSTTWCEGYESFDPTSFQISNIHAGTGADNVIPGELSVQFNFRYSPAVTAESLEQRLIQIINHYSLKYKLECRTSGLPFFTPEGALLTSAIHSIQTVTGRTPTLSTSGGTSDGRFIATLGAEVVEIGPVNASIHKINEHVAIADLEPLRDIYYHIAKSLLK